MINYLYILASLSLFHTALGAVAAAAPGSAQNGTDTLSPVDAITSTHHEQVVYASNIIDFAILLSDHNRTAVEESQTPDGARVYYSYGSTTDSQNKLPKDFFLTLAPSKQGGKNNKGFEQLTGCLNNATQLTPSSDKVYRSSGSSGSSETPVVGSTAVRRCQGWNHFSQCVQRSTGQFALRCCNDEQDCPAPSGNQKCSDALHGSYGGCAEAKEPGK